MEVKILAALFVLWTISCIAVPIAIFVAIVHYALKYW